LELDNLTVEIRPRRPWAAVDLGVLMAKRWWLQLMQLWIITTLPIFLLLSVLPLQWLFWQSIIVWWLKPLFERPLLFVLSQTVFGQFPANKEVLKTSLQLLSKQMILSLTWRRLSPSRSLDLPVVQLEGLNGRRRSARLSVLHREGTSPATALTVFGAHVELFFTMAFVSLVFIFMPQGIHIPWDELYFEKQSRAVMLATNFFAYLSMAVVAPFYVATGFALYLNRRVRLEAWDIEIAFKRMINARASNDRKAFAASPSCAKIIACTALVLSLPLLPSDLVAENLNVEPERDVFAMDAESAEEQIEAIKKHGAFNVREVVRYPAFPWASGKSKKNNVDKRWNIDFGSFFSSFMVVGELLLWLSVLILIFFLAIKYGGWLQQFSVYSSENARKKRPSVLFGLDVAQESLPENVAVSALAYWKIGDHRQALSLLYRASLFQLMEYGVELREGDTEGVCLSKARKPAAFEMLPDGAIDYLESLTRVWQCFAYGHIEPEQQVALAMCHRWEKIWQREKNNAASQ